MIFSANLKWMIPGVSVNVKSLSRPLSWKTQAFYFGLIFCMPFIYPHLKSGFFRVQRFLFSTMAEATTTGPVRAPGVYSIAYVTAPSEEVAKTLSRGIVGEKLAACVNIIPKIVSIYEWKGEVNEDNEVLMIIKTRTSRVAELTDYVKKNHPYEVCEVISTEIMQGNQPYLDWIGETVPEKTK